MIAVGNILKRVLEFIGGSSPSQLRAPDAEQDNVFHDDAMWRTDDPDLSNSNDDNGRSTPHVTRNHLFVNRSGAGSSNDRSFTSTDDAISTSSVDTLANQSHSSIRAKKRSASSQKSNFSGGTTANNFCRVDSVPRSKLLRKNLEINNNDDNVADIDASIQDICGDIDNNSVNELDTTETDVLERDDGCCSTNSVCTVKATSIVVTSRPKGVVYRTNFRSGSIMNINNNDNVHSNFPENVYSNVDVNVNININDNINDDNNNYNFTTNMMDDIIDDASIIYDINDDDNPSINDVNNINVNINDDLNPSINDVNNINVTNIDKEEMLFTCFDDAIKFMHDFAYANSFHCVIRRSEKETTIARNDRGEVKYLQSYKSIVYECNMHGIYVARPQQSVTKRKLTHTQAFGCPFRASISYTRGRTAVRCRIINDSHNHRPQAVNSECANNCVTSISSLNVFDVVAIPYYTRPKMEEKSSLRGLLSMGTSGPNNLIVELHRMHPSTKVTVQQIKWFCQGVKMELGNDILAMIKYLYNGQKESPKPFHGYRK